MKFALKTVLAATAFVAATPSFAQVTIQENNGQLATHINADSGTTPGDATQRFGTTGSAPNNVLFDADTEIRITGGGFALVEDTTGAEDFYQLIVNPDESFTQIDFSLQFNGAESYFLVEYDLIGDAFGFITLTTLFQDTGLSDYLIDGNGLAFDAIRLTSVTGAGVATPTTIDFEKQNSLTLGGTAVPEPGTWAMMLMGFGAAGYAMRRRRKTLLPQLA